MNQLVKGNNELVQHNDQFINQSTLRIKGFIDLLN